MEAILSTKQNTIGKQNKPLPLEIQTCLVFHPPLYLKIEYRYLKTPFKASDFESRWILQSRLLRWRLIWKILDKMRQMKRGWIQFGELKYSNHRSTTPKHLTLWTLLSHLRMVRSLDYCSVYSGGSKTELGKPNAIPIPNVSKFGHFVKNHSKTEQMAAILSKTIRKPNHSKTERPSTIRILNMFGIWAPTVLILLWPWYPTKQKFKIA